MIEDCIGFSDEAHEINRVPVQIWCFSAEELPGFELNWVRVLVFCLSERYNASTSVIAKCDRKCDRRKLSARIVVYNQV